MPVPVDVGVAGAHAATARQRTTRAFALRRARHRESLIPQQFVHCPRRDVGSAAVCDAQGRLSEVTRVRPTAARTRGRGPRRRSAVPAAGQLSLRAAEPASRQRGRDAPAGIESGFGDRRPSAWQPVPVAAASRSMPVAEATGIPRGRLRSITNAAARCRPAAPPGAARTARLPLQAPPWPGAPGQRRVRRPTGAASPDGRAVSEVRRAPVGVPGGHRFADRVSGRASRCPIPR